MLEPPLSSDSANNRNSQPETLISPPHPHERHSKNNTQQSDPLTSKEINSIDCSCGPTSLLQTTPTVENDLPPPNSVVIQCPDTNGGEEESNFNSFINIGDCVSSAIAADPSIIGPHNLYHNQDMPAPDYQLLDNVSFPTSPNASSFANTSTVIPEEEENPGTASPISESVFNSTPIRNSSADQCTTFDVSLVGQAQSQSGLEKNNSTAMSSPEECPKSEPTSSDTVDGTDRHKTQVRVREDVGESSSSDSNTDDGGVMSDDELNDDEVAFALQAAEVASAWRVRAR